MKSVPELLSIPNAGIWSPIEKHMMRASYAELPVRACLDATVPFRCLHADDRFPSVPKILNGTAVWQTWSLSTVPFNGQNRLFLKKPPELLFKRNGRLSFCFCRTSPKPGNLVRFMKTRAIIKLILSGCMETQGPRCLSSLCKGKGLKCSKKKGPAGRKYGTLREINRMHYRKF